MLEVDMEGKICYALRWETMVTAVDFQQAVAATTPLNRKANMSWNVHNHKDELWVTDYATIYHPTYGQLCQTQKCWSGYLYYSIIFKDKAAAYNWIAKGCIADLQEGLSNLGVLFTTKCFVKQK